MIRLATRLWAFLKTVWCGCPNCTAMGGGPCPDCDPDFYNHP